jgi:signal transduction histidine kinase
MRLKTGQRAWIYWAIVAFLFVLCGFLAFLQNRWLDEVSSADRQRLRQDLQDELERLRHDFNQEIQSAVAAETPTPDQVRDLGAQTAAEIKFASRESPYFHSFAVVFGPQEMDRETDLELIDVPLRGSEERLSLELDLGYLRRAVFPALFVRYLNTGLKVPYEAEVVNMRDRNKVLYATGPQIDRSRPADGSINLLDLRPLYPHAGDLPFGRGGPPRGQPPRWQNAGVSAGLLALILATGALLVSSARRAHRLAELQFNFVTGVSHELRTPITVIRTAAFNLLKLTTQPNQVERYGTLIQKESEKLTTLVEQVLAFATARAGRAIPSREVVDVNALIEDVVSSNGALTTAGVTLEKHLDPALPRVLADPVYLRNALNNLLDNAVKYGLGDEKWIGIATCSIEVMDQAEVEIRVMDHGPGIPEDEQGQVFDPFFRSRNAIAEQVHGTGLGLSLVRNIIEEHHGSVALESEPGEGASIVLHLPAAK